LKNGFSSVLIGSLSSNSKAIVTAQTALSSKLLLLSKQNRRRKSTCKQIIEEKIEATIVNKWC
jgi:hypothetical protein